MSRSYKSANPEGLYYITFATVEGIDVFTRKEWMLSMFRKAGKDNVNNKVYQFWRQDNHSIELYSNAVIDIELLFKKRYADKLY
ncbi:MAG: hypothetical protein Q8O72_13945 [Bacteroidales bacterium]|nr:hypothetical protein [Bacteroidales bacterium]